MQIDSFVGGLNKARQSNMKLIKLFLFCILFFHLHASGIRNLIMLIDFDTERFEDELKYKARSTAQEFNGSGAVSNALLTALWQQAAPILVSSVTLQNIFLGKTIFADFITLSEVQLIAKYKDQKKYMWFGQEQDIKNFKLLCMEELFNYGAIDLNILSDVQKRELKWCHLCYLLPFNLNNWYVRRFGQHFYLFIPKTYFEQQKLKSDVEFTKFAKTLTQEECILGLKKGTDTLLANFENYKLPPKNFNYSKEFSEILKGLFVTIKDVVGNDKNKSDDVLPKWAICLEGHGGINSDGSVGFIAGLNGIYFKTLLEFLNNQVNALFLHYTTCYAGGTHLLKPYEEIFLYPPIAKTKEERQRIAAQIFNYVISAGTFLARTTSSYTPRIDTTLSKQHRVYFERDYKLFFKNLDIYFDNRILTNKLPLSSIINLVHTFLEPSILSDFKSESYYYSNQRSVLELIEKGLFTINSHQIPAIRYPGTSWFSIMDLGKNIKRITKTLIDSAEAIAKEIVINKETKALIFDIQEIYSSRKESQLKEVAHAAVRVPIVLKERTLDGFPTVLSSAFKPAVYYCDQIKAPKSGLFEIMKGFTSVKEHYGRFYYIKTLHCRNDLSAEQATAIGSSSSEKILTLTDVVIMAYSLDVRMSNPIQPVDPFVGIIFKHQGKLFEYVTTAKNDDEVKKIQESFGKGTINFKNSSATTIEYPYQTDIAAPRRLKGLIDALQNREKYKHQQSVFEPIQKELKRLHNALVKLHALLLQ